MNTQKRRVARDAAGAHRKARFLVSLLAMQDFQKKVVVITGAASGIGRAMADAFAKEGALLVIADIETNPLKTAEHEIRGSGVEVLAVRRTWRTPTALPHSRRQHLTDSALSTSYATTPVWVSHSGPSGSSLPSTGNGCSASICGVSFMACGRLFQFCCVSNVKATW